jgi:starch synthase
MCRYFKWYTTTDTYILDNYSIKDVTKGKKLNKKQLCKEFDLDDDKPLFIYIGRLVGEKAAELLPQAISNVFEYVNRQVNFLILGSGDPSVESQLIWMRGSYMGYYNSQIGYNEKLAHQMYASADFLLMPSRVEPCGLNQMYALKYGTIPIVRRTGGLIDTVVDFGEPNGYGVCFNNASVDDIVYSVDRAIQLFYNQEKMQSIQKQIMAIDNSWDKSAERYLQLYNDL